MYADVYGDGVPPITEEEENAYYDAMRIEGTLRDELGDRAFMTFVYHDDTAWGGFLEQHGIEQIGENEWAKVR